MKPDYAESFSLYSGQGVRKYLNAQERRRALAAIPSLRRDQALFALTLAWTGARISEVLALTPECLQIESSIIAFRTLKRRKLCVREVPIPPKLMQAIDRYFGLQPDFRDTRALRAKLWPWSRVTGWRVVKRVMSAADIHGCRATPRGLRHSFGIGTLQAGVPLNLIQRWLGHARISTTAIYANASGAEEISFAKKFWRTGAERWHANRFEHHRSSRSPP